MKNDYFILRKFIGLFLIGILVFVYYYFIKSDSLYLSVLVSLIIPIVFLIIDSILEKLFESSIPLKYRLILLWFSLFKKKRVRVSVSNLIRIRCKDYYLLIRKENKYAPLGGVSHFVSDELKNLMLDGDCSADKDDNDVRSITTVNKLFTIIKMLKSSTGNDVGLSRHILKRINSGDLQKLLLESDISQVGSKIIIEKARIKQQEATIVFFYYRIFEIIVKGEALNIITKETEKTQELELFSREKIENYQDNDIKEYAYVILI